MRRPLDELMEVPMVSSVARVRWRGDTPCSEEDVVAHEEPLEIQVNGTSLAVLMRTPGHDEALVLGFLLTERIITRREDVVSVRHCTVVPSPEAEDNVMQVTLASGITLDLERLKRNFYAGSSCGMCGKATLESALACAPPLTSDLLVSPEMLYQLPERLRSAQEVFDATGGLHAAGLFHQNGDLHHVREDIGRHNAVDKVIGEACQVGRATERLVLMVSGRSSFEIVQKAVAARIPVVAAVSAPSSLAIRLADVMGVTLIGFLRDGAMNVYAHPERVVQAP